jgi:hypothetical protein
VPENETLSCSGVEASRWRLIIEVITAGESDESLFDQIQTALYQGLRRAREQMAKRGVTLQALLEAALRSKGDLRRLVVQTRGHDYAQVLEQTATAFSGGSLLELVAEYLHALWDRVHGNIREQLIQADRLAACPGFLLRFDKLQPRVEAMLDQLARRLAENPSRIPPKPRRRGESSTLAERLKQSMLNGRVPE